MISQGKDKFLVLAIETATPHGGVAIVGEELRGEISLNTQETHSRRLLREVDFLLSRLNLSLKDLSGLAVSMGPGSFTGLRIGLATAKGLHLATGLPLVGVCTLEALAFNASLTPKLICPVLDARRKQVYTALYRAPQPETLEEIWPPSLLSPARLVSRISLPTLFLGDGLKAFGPFWKERLGELFSQAPRHLNHLRPAHVGFLARKRLLQGKVDDPYRLLPLYLRPSEAELKKGS